MNHPSSIRDLSSYRAGDFDRGASQLKEALWWIIRYLIFLPSLPFPSKIKCQILRIFGATIGTGVIIRPGASITFPWKLCVGDHTWIGEDSLILSLASVKIGSHCCISQRAFICTGSHDYKSSSFDLITKEIVLKDGSWVAAGAFIGPGSIIGEGSVVSALSCVSQPVAPYTVVAGNPAQEVRKIENKQA